MATSTPPSPLTWRTPNEILAMQFDESDSILDDRLIAAGQNSAIVGPAGTGKTRLVTQLAVANIVGLPDFLGLPLRGRSLTWLFIQAENDNRRFQKDLVFIKSWVGNDESWAKVNRQLIIHTLESDFDQVLFLDRPETCVALREKVQDCKPNAVSWDCLQYFAIGELNKDAEMFATIMKIAQITKQGDVTRFPLILHHALTGIAGIAKVIGRDRASFGRNSKVMNAWCRGQINVAPADLDNNDRIIIGCGKCSNGKEFEPFSAVLNSTTHIYERDPEFDVAAWHHQILSKKKGQQGPSITDDMVAEAINGKSTKLDLATHLSVRWKCGMSTAYAAIARADKGGRISVSKSDGFYVRV